MNILHHKSWHVRNKDNIQRVRRDEAKAAAEQKEAKKKQEIAESEARLEILRAKSSQFKKDTEISDLFGEKNVNLFEREELGKHDNEKNQEVELEKKVEKEKFEKKIGLLKYLVDDEMDIKAQPWYKTVKSKTSLNDDESNESKNETDLKRKLQQDPLTYMNSLIKEKHDDKHKKRKKEAKNDTSTISATSTKSSSSFSSKQKKEKEKSEHSSSKKTIEALRAERLKRESEERIRVQRLLNNYKDEQRRIEIDDRRRKYNNQFNPELSRF